MLKKHFSIVLLMTSVVFAENSEEPSKTTGATGFYGGSEVGITSNKAKTKVSDKTKNKSKIGFIAGIFGGYNHQFRKFIAGLEANVDFRMADSKLTNENVNLSARRKYSFGIATRFGGLLNSNLNAYLSVGLLGSKFRIRADEEKSNPFKTSMFLGLGLEKSIGNALFVRGEVNKNLKKKAATFSNSSVSLEAYTFKIGGGYRF